MCRVHGKHDLWTTHMHFSSFSLFSRTDARWLKSLGWPGWTIFGESFSKKSNFEIKSRREKRSFVLLVSPSSCTMEESVKFFTIIDQHSAPIVGSRSKSINITEKENCVVSHPTVFVVSGYNVALLSSQIKVLLDFLFVWFLHSTMSTGYTGYEDISDGRPRVTTHDDNGVRTTTKTTRLGVDPNEKPKETVSVRTVQHPDSTETITVTEKKLPPIRYTETITREKLPKKTVPPQIQVTRATPTTEFVRPVDDYPTPTVVPVVQPTVSLDGR